MYRLPIFSLTLALTIPGSPPLADPPDTWDLSSLYATDQQWEDSLRGLPKLVEAVEAYRGKLGSDPAALLGALDAYFALDRSRSRMAGYAGMRADEDTRESGPQGMEQSLQSALADVQAAVAWFDPEILALPAEHLAGFLAREPRLAPYERYLERLEKSRPHLLDSDGERLLGMTRRIRGTGSTIGGLLRDAEIPWPTIRLSDGSEARIDAAGYSRIRASSDRADREKAYRAFYGQLRQFRGTLAATLSATVQEHVFEARARNYDSTLESALARNEVDPAVYRMLIAEINANLPTLHRYLRLRGEILGLDDPGYHDMYPSLVERVTADYNWENSKRLVADALAPLGSEYVERFRQALDARWVDVYPRPGKRSGAYVNDSAYDVHPFMLLNHTDDYNGATTLAHEGGHLMHSWYSQEAQPYPTSNYAIFVAEVASTVNEVIFFRNLVADAESDDARLALLGNFLEGLRTVVFRQTQFAEFELAIHEAVERGEPLTGETLDGLYSDLLRRYYGEAEGVVAIDDRYTVEWAFVPHFHYNFYVYQYATSYVAAIALAEGILEGKPAATERYTRFLRSGSTAPPVELLRRAGVDMTSPEPIRAAMRLMNTIMDQIDSLRAGQADRAGRTGEIGND